MPTPIEELNRHVMEMFRQAFEDHDEYKDMDISGEQEQIDYALRKKYEIEMENYERTSNQILEEVRKQGVSVHSKHGTQKKLPEQVNDIHILISYQKPEFVEEGVDTSEKLEEEVKNQLANAPTDSGETEGEETTDSTESGSSSGSSGGSHGGGGTF